MNFDSSMTDYVKKLLPKNALAEYIISEDFNNDGLEDLLLGYTVYHPYPPLSRIIIISRDRFGDEKHDNAICKAGFTYNELFSADGRNKAGYCIIDNIIKSDIDGDGTPELILSLADSNNKNIKIYIFDWADDGPSLRWCSESSFFHGSLDVFDIDNDGIEELVVEWSTDKGMDIIDSKRACYFYRESCSYKFPQGFKKGLEDCTVQQKILKPRKQYLSYNTSLCFLQNIKNKDYEAAYKQVILPSFIGLGSRHGNPGKLGDLDDWSLNSFSQHLDDNIRPYLMNNLNVGKLLPAEPLEDFCFFAGKLHNFSIELVNKGENIKIRRMLVSAAMI
jgi:hypothetical protein